MDKKILAAQKFLKGLTALPTYVGIRSKQFEHLCGVIEKGPLVSTGTAGDLVAALDESLWDSGQLATLKASKIGDLGRERRAMQDWVNFPYYLTEELSNMSRTSQNVEVRLEALTKHLARLGLRCPTEHTVAAVVWYACFVFRTNDVYEDEKFKALQASKPKVKRWLAGLAAPAVHLEVLPQSVDQCPAALMQSAYPTGFQAYAPEGVDVGVQEEIIRSFPLQKRNQAFERRQPSQGMDSLSDLRGLGEVLGGLLAGSQRQTSQESLASQAREAPKNEVPMLDISAGGVLALEDQKPASTPAPEDGETIEDQLETLRESLVPMKRPAAKGSASSAKASPKKKSTGGATSKKTPGTALKKKSVAKAVGSAPSEKKVVKTAKPKGGATSTQAVGSASSKQKSFGI